MASMTWDVKTMTWKKIGEPATPAAQPKPEWRNRRGYRITRPQATYSFGWGQVILEARRAWIRFERKPGEDVRRMIMEELGGVWSGTERAWMIDERLTALEIDLAVSRVPIPFDEAGAKTGQIELGL